MDRCWGKRRAHERRLRLDGLQALVTNAQLDLERESDNCHLQVALAAAREALTTFNSTQAKWVDAVIQARWTEDGDRSTKLFFQAIQGSCSSKRHPRPEECRRGHNYFVGRNGGPIGRFLHEYLGPSPQQPPTCRRCHTQESHTNARPSHP